MKVLEDVFDQPMSEIPTKSLKSRLDLYFDEWEKNNEVFSLTDFCEIVRELTLREEL